MLINDQQSFKVTCLFKDDTNQPVKPESLTYILQKDDGTVVRTVTVTPTGTSYVIPITVEDNTLGVDDIVERKLIVDWVYNNGTKGDRIKVDYSINPV